MNRMQTIILKFVAMMSFIAMVFSVCKIDADAIDWGPTDSNRYFIQNLGSNADILDIVEYLDNNWNVGIRLCDTPYSGACSTCLSLQGTDQSIKDKIEEHMKPGKNGGMNCTGLVGFVYRQKGADLTKITQIRKGWYINATNWHNTASGQGGIAYASRTYRYNTIQEMLSAGKAIKGDLIFFEPKNWNASGADCHIGFYWGNYKGHDQFLHDSIHPNRGAQITSVTPKCDSYVYVIKSAPSRITFDKNTTDTVTNMPANGKKYINSPFIFPDQIPKREGYTFKGWDRDKNNTSGVFPGFEWWIEDENQTVYAIWEKNKNYNVKYVVDGDKQFTKTMEQEVNKDYTVLSLTDIASTAAKTGYTFSNWECNYYASESNISTKTYNPGDTYKNLSSPGTTATFTSKWKANTYTIKYNANSGSGTMSNQSATYDQNVTLNKNKFTRTGYTFLGWSEDKSATTPTYTDGQTVKNLTSTNGATVNLYAVWQKNAVSTYIIRFNANGGSGTMANMTCEVGKGYYLTKNAFTKSGFTFKGWATISNSSTVRYSDQAYVTDLTTTNGAAITLYAVWESNAKNYTIRFNGNGATSGSMSNMTCKVGNTYQLTKNAFYKDGYSFVGWNTLKSSTSAKYSDGEFVTDLANTNGAIVDLYAVWKENAKSYTIRFNSNDGSGYMSDMTCIVGYSYRLSSNQFTKTDYTFKGWSLSSGSNNRVDYSENAYVTDLTTTNGKIVTLYAVWEKNADSYTIHFDSNGGTGSMSDMICKLDTYYTLSANKFTYSGYTFKGWSLTKGQNNRVNWSNQAQVKNIAAVSETKILYAVWEKNADSYTIRFNGNGATAGSMSNMTCKVGTKYSLSANQFTRKDYTFIGWSLNSGDNNRVRYADRQTVQNLSYTNGATVNLYAVWQSNASKAYTVYFDANGGTGSMSPITAVRDERFTLPANQFKRTNYKFQGWAVSRTGQKKYNDKDTAYNLASEGSYITLYAVWKQVSSDTLQSYTIIFNANGGTGTMANQKVTSEPVTLNKNQFTKEGYVFAGWRYNGDSTLYPDQASVTWGTDKNLWSDGTTYQNVVIYAEWKPINYTIRFNSNYGSGYMSDISATYGSDVTLSYNQFTRTNYTFKGWSLTDGNNNSVKYTNHQTVSNLAYTDGAIVTLYAVWEKNDAKTYTVHFNANGGSGSMSSIAKNRNEYFILPKNQFTRDGYTFQGWALSSTASKTYNDRAIVTNLAEAGSSTTLYAVWKQNVQTYTIRFNANGGMGYMSDMTCLCNSYITLQQNSFYRDNYTFQGWATTANGSVKYYDKQSVYNLTSAGSSTTLYAVWQQNASKYTIHFDANSGSGSMDDMSCVQDEYVALNPNAFYKTGYVFQGWSTSKDSSVVYQDRATVVNLTDVNGGTVTLYAVWAKEQYTYTIHFVANGGSGSMDDMTCKTDEYVTLDSNAFYRTNYTFKGWATSSNGSVKYKNNARVYNLSTKNGDTVNLYAVWEKNVVPYNVIYRWNDQNSLSETKQYNMDTTYNFLTLQTSSLGTIEKPGYTFYRWYQLTSNSYWGWNWNWSYTYYEPGTSFKNLTTMANGTVTLYGEWTANNYKIHYNANGGSGTMNDQSATYDQDVTLSTNKFTRDGYQFMGWATSNSGSKKYDDGQTVRNLTTTNGSTVTLYAVWKKATKYTIHFDANGGKGTMTDMVCYYGVDVVLNKNAFTKEKANFTGWSFDKDAIYPNYGEQSTVRNLTATDNGVVTLYAVWDPIPDVIVDDIYIFKDEKDKVTTEFVETESNLKIEKNNSETNVLEYHNTNIDEIKSDLDKDKDETTVKFDVTYNTGYKTTATCKLYVIDIVHKDSTLSRVRYINDAQYISESSVWSNSTMNTILRNALGVKENMDDIPSTEVEKADTNSQDNSSSDKINE